MKYLIHEMKLEMIPDYNIQSTTVERFKEEYLEIFQTCSNWKEVHLNLVKVEMIDSQGINALAGLIHFVSDKGKSISASIASPHIEQLFTFTRMGKLMTYQMVNLNGEV
jgi:anti-anti-sigma factor